MLRHVEICTLFFVAAAALASPHHHKIAPDLKTADAGSAVDVIVQFTAAPTERHHRKVTNRGGILKADLSHIRAALYSVPAGELAALAEDPEVVYISPDRQVRGALDNADVAVNASIAYSYGWNGNGIGVAVIDSGIANHPDLKDSSGALRIVYSEDFVGGGTDDHYGHGQHVAGIIAGNGASSTGSTYFHTFRGMAPSANLINLRVLDQNGQGTDSTVISGIQQAINLKKNYNIRIINLSLGRAVYESYTLDPLCQAVEKAWKAGIVVVVAAGNQGRDNSHDTNGYATIQAPGNDPYGITVGAMKTMATPSRSDDLIASYSSKGPTIIDHIVKPDVVAPGNRMASLLASTAQLENQYPNNAIPLTYYQNTGSGALSNYYYRMSGTSMAAPMVSGAAALMLQKSPKLTPDQVKAIIMKTAYKSFPASSVATDPTTGMTYTSQYDIFTIGAGYLDILAALSSSDSPSTAFGAALSPTASYNASRGTVSLTNTGTAAIWGTSVVWGDNVVWGSSVVWGDNVVWGSSVVWGDKTTEGFSVVWGSSAVSAATNQTGTEGVPLAIAGEN